MSSLQIYDTVDTAIVNTLRKNPQGLRYNALHAKSGEEFGQRIWIKTYNDHLKGLVKAGVIERIEETRFKVTYKLKIPETSQAKMYLSRVRKEIRVLKETLPFLLKLIIDFEKVSAISKKGSLSNDSAKLEKFSDAYIEALIAWVLTQLIDISAEMIEFPLLKAMQFYYQNPAWSRFVIDETAEIFRDISFNLVEAIGEFSQKSVLVTKILEKAASRHKWIKRSRKISRTRAKGIIKKQIEEIGSAVKDIIVRILKQHSVVPRWCKDHVEFFMEGRPIEYIEGVPISIFADLLELDGKLATNWLRKELGFKSL